MSLQAARAVAYNLASFAKLVKRDNATIGECLNIDGNNRVSLSNPTAFHLVTQQIQTEYLNKQETPQHNAPSTSADAPNGPNTKAPKGGRAAQISRLLKLWSPFGRKAVNVGIIKPDTSIANDPQGKKEAMITFWGSTFKSKPIDETLARTFATKYAVPLDLSTTHPPSEDDYATFPKERRTVHLAKTESVTVAGSTQAPPATAP